MKIKRSSFLMVFVLGIALNAEGQWFKQTGGLPTTWGNGMAIDACNASVAVIAVGVTSPSVYLTKDGGMNFLAISTPKVPDDISIVDTAHIWFVSDSCIYATSDGGTTWQKQFADTSVTSFFDYIRMFDLNNGVAVGDAPIVGYTNTAGKPMPVLRTTDGGSHWTNVNVTSLIDMCSGDIWRRIDFVSPSVGYIEATPGTGGVPTLYKTTDGGATWSTFPGVNGGTVVRFYNQNIGLVSKFGEFYRTTNSGVSWDTIDASSLGSGWGNDIQFLPGNPAYIWYTNYNKMFFSDDTGKTWTQQVVTSGNLGGRDIVFSDATHGWLLCDNGTMYNTTNGDRVRTGVPTSRPEIPRDFLLHQNYPNPFNPSTTIRFDLPRESFVRLEVFNVLGERVGILVNEIRQAGKFTETFHAANLPSGIYFSRLQAGAFTATRKLVLMK